MTNTNFSKLSLRPRKLLELALAEHRELDASKDDLDPTVDRVDIHRFYASKDPEQPSRPYTFSSQRVQSILKQNEDSLLLWSRRSGGDGENLSVYLVGDQGETFTYTTAVDSEYGSRGWFLCQKDGQVMEGYMTDKEARGLWKVYGEGV